MKRMQTDPWEGVGAKYPVGAKFKGQVTNVTDYGAFVELEPGVEGLAVLFCAHRNVILLTIVVIINLSLVELSFRLPKMETSR